MSTKKKRQSPEIRKPELLRVAVELSRRHGYNKITRDAIAAEAGVSMGLVTLYLGTMANLRRDIMRAAVRDGIVEIVAQGIAAGDEHALKAPRELKQQIARFVLQA